MNNNGRIEILMYFYILVILITSLVDKVPGQVPTPLFFKYLKPVPLHNNQLNIASSSFDTKTLFVCNPANCKREKLTFSNMTDTQQEDAQCPGTYLQCHYQVHKPPHRESACRQE